MQKIFLHLAYLLCGFGCAISNEIPVAGEHRRGSLVAATWKGGDETLSDLLPPAQGPCKQLTGVRCVSDDVCLHPLVYSYPIKIKVWWRWGYICI